MIRVVDSFALPAGLGGHGEDRNPTLALPRQERGAELQVGLPASAGLPFGPEERGLAPIACLLEIVASSAHRSRPSTSKLWFN